MENILEQIINNFDFSYMLIINVLTYILIELFNKKFNLNIWFKRLILLICIIVVTICYKIIGYDNNIVLLNSAILSPISWSWIFKPIINKFKNKK